MLRACNWNKWHVTSRKAFKIHKKASIITPLTEKPTYDKGKNIYNKCNDKTIRSILTRNYPELHRAKDDYVQINIVSFVLFSLDFVCIEVIIYIIVTWICSVS